MPIDAVLARVSELDSLISQLNGAPSSAARASRASFQRVLASRTAAAAAPSVPASPAPGSASASVDGTRYGFVRRSDAAAGDVSYYQQLAANGLGGVVFDSTDPELDTALAT